MSKIVNRLEKQQEVIALGKRQGMMISYGQLEEIFDDQPMTEAELEEMEAVLRKNQIRLTEGDVDLDIEELMTEEITEEFCDKDEVNNCSEAMATEDQGVSVDPIKVYLREIGQYPLLNAEEEHKLAVLACSGDLHARQELVNCNLRLVVSIAKKYRNRGIELMDMIQMGNVGLMRAIEKYNPEMGNRLSTYSTWWIRQAITRGIYENGRSVRLPVHMAEKINRYKMIAGMLISKYGKDASYRETEYEYAVETLRKKNKGHEPTEAMVQKLMAKKSFKEEVYLIRESLQSVSSLDTPVGEKEDDSFGDFIPDEVMEKPEDHVETEALKDALETTLRMLPEREAQILVWRHVNNYTLDQCGQRLNITRERVRQLESKAIRTIRSNPTCMNMLRGFCNVGVR